MKRKEGRRREGKTEGKVERVIRSECGPQLLSSSDINFTVEEKGERANETIRREREESESNPIYRMSLSLSLSLSRALSGYPGPKIFCPSPLRVLQKERRENHFSHRMSPSLSYTIVRVLEDSKRYERNGDVNFSLAVSRVGRLYLLDLTRFFDNQGEGGKHG